MADKVAEVHGSRHAELRELAEVFRGLRDELTPHLTNEEERVFPAVRRLAEHSTAEPDVQAALHALEEEHDRAGAALARLRARFERELHEHVHLENNLLFPRVVSLQAKAEGRDGATQRGRR